MEESKYVIDARNIVKVYGIETGNAFKALKNIDLKVEKGEFVCVMGPSGAGKSTLINNISTIDTPTSGFLYIDGKEVSTLSASQIGKFRYEKLGFIFQSFNLLYTLTIFENIAVPLTLANESKEEITKRVNEVAKRLNIESILTKFPSECSGGQIQRAGVARGLVTHPKLIIADEPTGNLDSKNSHEILTIFKELNEQDGISIVLVTHDPQIASYSSKLLYIRDGIIDQTIERKDLTQKEYFYKIVDINSSESQELFE
ncbi:MAG: ABC transporter ATP-binding protein [Thomasclavelia sp.]|jgi:putative ABC transport system ATP-binding protein|nr:ABC transporter ATP-binding protein [Thomasclavelia sp.]